MFHRKFRRTITTMLSVMLVLTLAACGGSSGTTSASDTPKPSEPASAAPTPAASETPKKEEPVELTFWTLGTNGYDELAKEYTKLKPNVTIKIQNTSDQTAHHNNMLTALSAGKGAPDIFMLEIAFLERFMEAKDSFVNLNDLGAKDLKGNYLDWKWNQASADNGNYQFGLPTDVGPTVAYYRTDLLAQVGMPTDPEGFYKTIDTWDKFDAVAKEFFAKTGKSFVDMPDLLYNSIRDQANEIYYDKDDNFIGDTNPQVRKAWDYTVKAIQEGWVGSNSLWTPEWGQAQNNGDFAVLLGPAWMSGVIKGNAKDAAGKWMITQMPEGPGNWGGSFISLPKEGKHQKEAFEFISWLLNKDQQLTSFKTNGLMPSIPALYDDPAFTGYIDEYYNKQAVAVEFGKAAKNVKQIHYGKLHDGTDSIFKDGLRNVLSKKSDPNKEWDDVIKKVKELNKRS